MCSRARTGQVLIGSSRQFGAEALGDRRRAFWAACCSAPQEYMPRLSELSAIRAWTGFRAATPDKLPLIGPCPGQPRLYLATGHEGLGITTSLATGKLIADQLLGRPSAIPIEPYLPTTGARMPDPVTLSVNGRRVAVPAGAMVSAAVALAGVDDVPPLGHRRAARSAVRHGHLF